MSEAKKERPILFSSDMVRAILDGRKSVTRRVVAKANSDVSVPWERLEFDDAKIPAGCPWTFTFADNGYLHVPTRPHPEEPQTPDDWTRNRVYPRFEVGDRLWVRETWHETEDVDGRPVIEYKAGGSRMIRIDSSGNRSIEHGEHRMLAQAHWRPSIFLPRWACRIELEITGVRVERLQDITFEDALAEGVVGTDEWRSCRGDSIDVRGIEDEDESISESWKQFAVEAYRTLWDRINGKKHPWASNCWVLVVEFQPIQRSRA